LPKHLNKKNIHFDGFLVFFFYKNDWKCFKLCFQISFFYSFSINSSFGCQKVFFLQKQWLYELTCSAYCPYITRKIIQKWFKINDAMIFNDVKQEQKMCRETTKRLSDWKLSEHKKKCFKWKKGNPKYLTLETIKTQAYEKKHDDFIFCFFWYAQQQNQYNLYPVFLFWFFPCCCFGCISKAATTNNRQLVYNLSRLYLVLENHQSKKKSEKIMFRILSEKVFFYWGFVVSVYF
jgi:hypothetical protein